jgi:hypothetical protein
MYVYVLASVGYFVSLRIHVRTYTRNTQLLFYKVFKKFILTYWECTSVTMFYFTLCFTYVCALSNFNEKFNYN